VHCVLPIRPVLYSLMTVMEPKASWVAKWTHTSKQWLQGGLDTHCLRQLWASGSFRAFQWQTIQYPSTATVRCCPLGLSHTWATNTLSVGQSRWWVGNRLARSHSPAVQGMHKLHILAWKVLVVGCCGPDWSVWFYCCLCAAKGVPGCYAL